MNIQKSTRFYGSSSPEEETPKGDKVFNNYERSSQCVANPSMVAEKKPLPRPSMVVEKKPLPRPDLHWNLFLRSQRVSERIGLFDWSVLFMEAAQ